MYLVHSECVTAAGLGVNQLLSGLYEGIDYSKVIQGNEFFKPVQAGGRVCFISEEIAGQKIISRNFDLAFQNIIQKCWQTFYQNLAESAKQNLLNSKTLVLLSSTKGHVEDYIWKLKDMDSARVQYDPFSSIVKWFKNETKEYFSNVDFEVVSNACASSHVSIELAHQCLNNNSYQNILILSADLIGPFIYQGFNSLKVLTHTFNKPFDDSRDGLQLGEAVALMLFSNFKIEDCQLKITSVFSETEGGSVTRPSMDGRCLFRLMKKVIEQSQNTPDFFLAHGTGTQFNDQSELFAFEDLKKELQLSAPITGIKWSVGHTLGSSGLLDVIAAGEIIKRNSYFKIKNSKLNSKLNSNIKSNIKSAIVTSLGFGGIHSALMLEAVKAKNA